MGLMLDDISRLSREIGPRPAGTEEERISAMYIAENIQKRSGLPFSIEDFDGARGKYKVFDVLALISSVLLLLAFLLPVISVPTLIVTLILAVIIVLEFFDRPIISNFFKSGVSQNVVAKYVPAYSSANKQPIRKRKVIFISHYDSGKAVSSNNSTMFFAASKITHLLSIVMCCLIPIILLIKSIVSKSDTGNILFLIIFGLIIVLLSSSHFILNLVETKALYNEAANCNASGNAALIEIARQLGTGSYQVDIESENNPVIHGKEVADNSGYVPKEAKLNYDSSVFNDTNNNENFKDDPLAQKEQSLRQAKAAVEAFMSPRKPRAQYDDEGNLINNENLSSTAQSNKQEKNNEQKINNNNNIDSRLNLQANEKNKITVKDTVIKENKVPSWFKSARSKVDSSDNDSEEFEAKRSRFAHTIDILEKNKLEKQRKIKEQEEEERDKIRQKLIDSNKQHEKELEEQFGSEKPFFRNNQDVENNISDANEDTSSLSIDERFKLHQQKNLKNSNLNTETSQDNVDNTEISKIGNNLEVKDTTNFNIKDPKFLDIQKNITSSNIDTNSLDQKTVGFSPVDINTLNLDNKSNIKTNVDDPKENQSDKDIQNTQVINSNVIINKTSDASKLKENETQNQFSNLENKINSNHKDLKNDTLNNSENNNYASNTVDNNNFKNNKVNSLLNQNIPSVVSNDGDRASFDTESKTVNKFQNDISSIDLSKSQQYAPLDDQNFISSNEMPKNSTMIELPEVYSSDVDIESDPNYAKALESSTVNEKPIELERGKFGTGSFAAVSESEGVAGATGTFAPVTDSLIEDASKSGEISDSAMIIEDADDSIYQDGSFTDKGAFAGRDYVDMPDSKKRGLFGLFGKKKKHDALHSSNFSATEKNEENVIDDNDDWNGGSFSVKDRLASLVYKKNGNNQQYENELEESDTVDSNVADENVQDGAFEDFSQDKSSQSFNELPITNKDYKINAIIDKVPEFEEQIQDFHNSSINMEVWMVALGSEINENAGIKAFFLEHAQELRGSIIVELEALGAGKLSLVNTEGLIRKTKTSSRLKRYVRQASNTLGLSVTNVDFPWSTSSTAFANRCGYKTLHFAGVDGDKPAYYGEKEDVVENIDEATLQTNVRYLLELLQTI